MSFNGFTLAGSYPYEMAADESRIVENIQYFGKHSIQQFPPTKVTMMMVFYGGPET